MIKPWRQSTEASEPPCSIQDAQRDLKKKVKDEQRLERLGKDPEVDPTFKAAQDALKAGAELEERQEQMRVVDQETGKLPPSFFQKYLRPLLKPFSRSTRGVASDPGELAVQVQLRATLKMLITKSMQRQEYESLCRIVFSNTIRSPDDDSHQSICCFSGKCQVTGPILYLHAFQTLRMLEQLNDIGRRDSSEPLLKLRGLVLDLVELIIDISQDMYSYWYYGFQHEKLLSSMIKPRDALIEQTAHYIASSAALDDFFMMNLSGIETSLVAIREGMMTLPSIRLQKNHEQSATDNHSALSSQAADSQAGNELYAICLDDKDRELREFLNSLHAGTASTDASWYSERLESILTDHLGLRVVEKRAGPREPAGQGAYGRVEWTKLEDGPKDMPGEVAVKTLNYDKNSLFACLRFLREARSWSIALGSGDSGTNANQTYITPLYEVWAKAVTHYNYDYPALVMPWAKEGNLHNFLIGSSSSRQFTDKDRLLLLLHVAKGISHLHSRAIVHGDLNPANILVFNCDDEAFRYKACLADFGISKVWDNGPDFKTRGGITFTSNYASPELTDECAHEVYGKFPTTSSDIYSFGCVLFEALTGKRPFEKTPSPMSALNEGKTPLDFVPSTQTVSEDQKKLLLKCFQFIPEYRPKAKRLIEDIEKLRQQAQ